MLCGSVSGKDMNYIIKSSSLSSLRSLPHILTCLFVSLRLCLLVFCDYRDPVHFITFWLKGSPLKVFVPSRPIPKNKGWGTRTLSAKVKPWTHAGHHKASCEQVNTSRSLETHRTKTKKKKKNLKHKRKQACGLWIQRKAKQIKCVACAHSLISRV